MNDQMAQQLAQIAQQLAQLAQQMTSGGGDDGMDEGGQMPDEMSKGDPDMMMGKKKKPNPMMQKDMGMDEDDDMDEDDSDMNDDDMGMGDDDMGGGGSLHDRISKLESHTGLKKAVGTPAVLRIGRLEEQILGEQYQGTPLQRVQQLERYTRFQKSARQSTARRSTVHDEAPEEIQLDTLIKTAVQSGIKQGMRAIASEYPNPDTLRKHTNGRRVTPTVSTDGELIKAAQQWGMDVESEKDLDQPVGLGDYLLMQYHANQSGLDLFENDEE